MSRAAARSAAPPVQVPGAKPTGTVTPTPGGNGPVKDTKAPVTDPANPAPEAREGFIATADHKTAVQNARRAGQKDFIVANPWAKDLTPEVGQRHVTNGQRLEKNPVAFARDLIRELREQGQDLSSLGLADVSQPAGPTPAGLPKPSLVSKSGIQGYTAQETQQVAAYEVAQAVAKLRLELTGQLQPVLDERRQAQETRQQEEARQAAYQEQKRISDAEIAEARKNPLFVKHEKAIAEKLNNMSAEYVSRVGVVAAMHAAYSAVLSEVANGAEQSVRDDMKRKAAAGISISPNGPAMTGNVAKPRNEKELRTHMAAKAAEMGIR